MSRASKSWLSDPLDIFKILDAIAALEHKPRVEEHIFAIKGRSYRIKRDGNSVFHPSETAYRIDPVDGFTPCGRFSVLQLNTMLEEMG